MGNFRLFLATHSRCGFVAQRYIADEFRPLLSSEVHQYVYKCVWILLGPFRSHFRCLSGLRLPSLCTDFGWAYQMTPLLSPAICFVRRTVSR